MRNYCIIYKRLSNIFIFDIINYVDSDFANDEDNQKSYIDYIFIINDSAVLWFTYKQSTIAFSNMKSKYMILFDAAREALTRWQLFKELLISFISKSVIILINNQTALNILENSTNYRQAKHIDIYYHIIRHYIYDRKIEIDYISSNYQPVDIFIKALKYQKHHQFCQMIGLWNSFEAFDDI